jgi:hypothetical protein
MRRGTAIAVTKDTMPSRLPSTANALTQDEMPHAHSHSIPRTRCHYVFQAHQPQDALSSAAHDTGRAHQSRGEYDLALKKAKGSVVLS